MFAVSEAASQLIDAVEPDPAGPKSEIASIASRKALLNCARHGPGGCPLPCLLHYRVEPLVRDERRERGSLSSTRIGVPSESLSTWNAMFAGVGPGSFTRWRDHSLLHRCPRRSGSSRQREAVGRPAKDPIWTKLRRTPTAARLRTSAAASASSRWTSAWTFWRFPGTRARGVFGDDDMRRATRSLSRRLLSLGILRNWLESARSCQFKPKLGPRIRLRKPSSERTNSKLRSASPTSATPGNLLP